VTASIAGWRLCRSLEPRRQRGDARDGWTALNLPFHRMPARQTHDRDHRADDVSRLTCKTVSLGYSTRQNREVLWIEFRFCWSRLSLPCWLSASWPSSKVGCPSVHSVGQRLGCGMPLAGSHGRCCHVSRFRSTSGSQDNTAAGLGALAGKPLARPAYRSSPGCTPDRWQTGPEPRRRGLVALAGSKRAAAAVDSNPGVVAGSSPVVVVALGSNLADSHIPARWLDRAGSSSQVGKVPATDTGGAFGSPVDRKSKVRPARSDAATRWHSATKTGHRTPRYLNEEGTIRLRCRASQTFTMAGSSMD
jgi:hypothetical protein